LMPSLNRVREQGKRAVCLNNMKQLALTWIMYADENDDRIVNGEAAEGSDGLSPPPTVSHHIGEPWWTGDDCHTGFMSGQQLPQDTQVRAIRAGALYEYCKDIKLYRCPTGIRGEMRTYTITDAMNGLYRPGTRNGGSNIGIRVGRTVLWIKRKAEITVPGPAYRLVFLDEGRVTPDSYAVHYQQGTWWDPPFVRHGDGTNVSYADGHAAYWKWNGSKTIRTGKMANPLHQMVPDTPEERDDLERMQIAVWGRLGY
jgi:prepilin-type processing-associated H-X9-DG protein